MQTTSSSPLAGKTVRIISGELEGNDYRVEDYWKEVAGESWLTQSAKGNVACLQYMMRNLRDELPKDDNVLYGKIGCLGHLVHVTEVEEIKDEPN